MFDEIEIDGNKVRVYFDIEGFKLKIDRYDLRTHNFMELSSYSLKEEIDIILESQVIETFFLVFKISLKLP